MTIEVEIQGTGQIAEFPDGTPNEVIVSALQQFETQQDTGEKNDEFQGFFGNQALDLPLEFMQAVNRGATNLADFLSTDQINAVLQLAGSEKRVPSITQSLSGATAGGVAKEGLARDIVSAAGEVVPAALASGGAFRQVAKALPQALAPSTTANVIKQLGSSTAAQDVGFGALSGAGGEVGRQENGQFGQLVGSILAPASFAGVKFGLTK